MWGVRGGLRVQERPSRGVDVPAEGACLFWHIALRAYLAKLPRSWVPVRNPRATLSRATLASAHCWLALEHVCSFKLSASWLCSLSGQPLPINFKPEDAHAPTSSTHCLKTEFEPCPILRLSLPYDSGTWVFSFACAWSGDEYNFSAGLLRCLTAQAWWCVACYAIVVALR